MQNTPNTGTTESDQPSVGQGDESLGDPGKGSHRGKRSPNGKASRLPACVLPNNMQTTFYIGGGNGVALVEGPLLALGWKRTVDKFDERFKLKWVECKSRINYSAFREGEQLVNHIPNCNLLTNKLGLINSLQEYERVTISTKGRPPRLQITDFHPETYRLDEKTDRELFLQQYKDSDMWICKPIGLNQGKGIFLIRSGEELTKLLEERDQRKELQKATRPLMKRIIQRYIQNPLLLDGRKFDIRAYMLIASTVPYLVLFHQGYIRLSCNKYNGEDSNLITHLTNQYVQKKDPQYKDVKEDTAWSMKHFCDYINDNVAQEKGLEPNWVFTTLTKQMQKIMIHCFNSVKHKMQTRIGYFDLYGLDFMIDTDMKVWLIEINVNPALSTNCEALKDAIPSVIEECLYICIECFERCRKHYPLMPLKSLKTFTILYCGTRLNAIPARHSRSVSPVKDAFGTGEKSRTTIFPIIQKNSPTRQVSRPTAKTPTSVQTSVAMKHEATPSATLTTSDMSDSALSDDVKLKMTHATPSEKRTRQRQERGN